MKVALLTLFGHLQSTSSLVNVVAEQLQMLLNAGISTKLLVCEQCPDSERYGIFLDERIEWVKVKNTYNEKPIIWYDYSEPTQELHDTFYYEAESIAKELVKHLSDVTVCIVHDILYHSVHLVNNVALREAQKELPDTKFLAFSHSAPLKAPFQPTYPFSCRFTPMPATRYVTFTYALIPTLAKQYHVPEGKCRVITHSLNLLQGMSADLNRIAQETDLLSPDILIVYPARFTPEKQFEKVAALAGALKSASHQSVKVIFCDIPAADTDLDSYKAFVAQTGVTFGLDRQDMVFTSDLGYANGFPREAVLDLFTLSNLFISASMSESFQLTVIEAASRGNFLVLNKNVPALEELGKHLDAYFIPWDAYIAGTQITESYFPSEADFLNSRAQEIVDLMMADRVLKAKTLCRQRFSPKWVWENQLEPIINE